ncbi:P-loop containing nucleoside triphosphate hydrolase protein [Colletotrichum eremochloae]|nr:P-loop containing nucleoside triphosphate hydrolase protein [Colletotrichum eremochloae]
MTSKTETLAINLAMDRKPTENTAGRAPVLYLSPSEQLSLWSSYGPELLKFRIEYVSDNSDGKKSFEGKIEEQGKLAHEREPPVFEYVEVRVTDDMDSVKAGNSESESSAPPYIKHRGNAYIRILSPAVCEALRCVVDYFPGIDLSKQVIDVPEPFTIFVFYEAQLTEYRERLQFRSEDVSTACLNRFAHKHIGIVQDFVRQKTSSSVEAERKRHARGYVTFDMLWLLYRPGSEVYYDPYDVGEHDPYIVEHVNFKLINGTTDVYFIDHWNLDANETDVGPSSCDCLTVKRFAGEKSIVSLKSYPCEYIKFSDGLPQEEVQSIRDHFMERGKKWYKMRQKAMCYQFDGCTTSYPRRKYNSLASVDPVQFSWSTPKRRSTEVRAHFPLAPGPLRICSCSHCEKEIYSHAVNPRFTDWIDINPLTLEGLTDTQYMFCDCEVETFLFKTRSWELLHIDGFEPATFDTTLFERLVLQYDTKELIRNLTAMYIRDDSKPALQDDVGYTKISNIHKRSLKTKGETTWSAYFIEGKGEGLTFLLHGKPGVGKTYTAECISHHTQRPLLSLTCSDIGVEPKTVEENLRQWFKLAEKWGAIMLIDEADIYMERREIQDLERNHLVAGFLRALEYYKGILFLTTNRVGTFDEAFISRIHIQIYYPPFREEERHRVWDSFFEKLEEDRETTMRIMQSTKDYIQSEDLRSLEWNGREIRNAFQVAVALAEARADRDGKGRVLIKPEHIKASVQMSKEFKQYVTKIYKQDPSKVAAAMGNRYDAYGTDSPTQAGKGDKKF